MLITDLRAVIVSPATEWYPLAISRGKLVNNCKHMNVNATKAMNRREDWRREQQGRLIRKKRMKEKKRGRQKVKEGE